MKKVLIITYYWVPSGGAGVQRWVKFAKYLRNYGWEPIIYTPENPEYPSTDHSFAEDLPENIEIIKTPIWEPYNVYRNLTGKKNQPINAGFISENKKSGWKDKLSIWVRGNFLIPDPRRFWIKPSVKFLTEYLQKNTIDAIITTGPPHSMHLIGMGLKKNFSHINWIADFRDPWTNIDFYKELNLTTFADKIHHKLEKKVIQQADAVVVVSSGMQQEFEPLNPKKLRIITNGYDETDVNIGEVELDRKFTLSHIGTLNNARNPKTLWKVLGEICDKNPDFKTDLQIKLIGKTDFSVFEALNNFGLIKNTEKIEYLSHSDAILAQRKSQILLLLINNSQNAKGILTGKFFEYLAAGRPILAIGPTDGDVATILNETGVGKMLDFYDEKATKTAILTYYDLFKSRNLKAHTKSVERFSRKSLTADLVNLLDTL